MSEYPAIPIGRPRASGEARVRACLWCDGPIPSGRDRFCCDRDRILYNNHKKLLGSRIIESAIIWRRSRGAGDFTRMCQAIDDILLDQRMHQRRNAA